MPNVEHSSFKLKVYNQVQKKIENEGGEGLMVLIKYENARVKLLELCSILQHRGSIDLLFIRTHELTVT